VTGCLGPVLASLVWIAAPAGAQDAPPADGDPGTPATGDETPDDGSEPDVVGASADPDAPDVDPGVAAEARLLFEEGVEYASQERWGEALEYFRRSREIVDRPSSAFNMAVALLRLGRPTEALQALDDYLRMSEPGSEPERREEARRLLELALSQTARITLEVTPSHAEVRVDGELVAAEGTERELTLDPGSHAVRVTAEGWEPQSFTLSVLDGERSRREVHLERIPLPPPPTPGLLEQPLFWVAVGVVVVGAGVGIGIAATSGTEAPYPGTTGVVLQGLSTP